MANRNSPPPGAKYRKHPDGREDFLLPNGNVLPITDEPSSSASPSPSPSPKVGDAMPKQKDYPDTDSYLGAMRRWRDAQRNKKTRGQQAGAIE